MKARTLLLLAVLSAIATFAALNWTVFNAPSTLSLGVATIEAPLGLVMLGLLVFLSTVFLVFVVYLQASLLFDARRHAKEMRANRELADKAEASRFTELREFLTAELRSLNSRNEASQALLMTRIEQLEHDLRAALGQSENILAAQIGELDHRLERNSPRQIASPSA